MSGYKLYLSNKNAPERRMKYFIILLITLYANIGYLKAEGEETDSNADDRDDFSFVLKLSNPKIWGGKDDQRGAHPWQALILTKQPSPGNNQPPREFMRLCGGTLIRNKWVLTAADCVSPAGKTKVFFGVFNKTNHIEGGRTKHRIARFVYHPCYDPAERFTGFNLVLLELETPELRYDPVCLDGSSKRDWMELKNNGALGGCVATGYGVSSSGSPADVLQQVRFSTVSHKSCVDAYDNYVTKNHICAFDKTKTDEDTCKGDMGGPLVCPNARPGCNGFYLAGVTLAGSSKCGVPGRPGIYTAVHPHLKWINSIMDGIPPNQLFSCPKMRLKSGRNISILLFILKYYDFVNKIE